MAGRPANITPAMEDYLKAIHALHERGERVTIGEIAEALKVSRPSVTNMVKRLHERELLDHDRYQDVGLTPAGELAALQVVRHHRLLELFLTQTLGVSCDQAHSDAERLEHVLSPELEKRIDSLLGFPHRDVFGDPIPRPTGF